MAAIGQERSLAHMPQTRRSAIPASCQGQWSWERSDGGALTELFTAIHIKLLVLFHAPLRRILGRPIRDGTMHELIEHRHGEGRVSMRWTPDHAFPN